MINSLAAALQAPFRLLLQAIAEIQSYTFLSVRAIANVFTRPIYVKETFLQMDRVGVGSATIILLTGFFTGAVLGIQSESALRRYGAVSITGQLVAITLIRELGPVLAALMVAGRIGSGIASELGSMVVSEQINAMRALGTDPTRKLVTPRMIATVVTLPLLTILCNAVGMCGGWVIARYKLLISSSQYWSDAINALEFSDVFGSLIKANRLRFHHLHDRLLRRIEDLRGNGRGGTFYDAGCCEQFHSGNRGGLFSEQPDYLPGAVSQYMIEFKNVTKSFNDDVILKNISFTITRGETKIILGASGSGKSTILRLILGLIRPDSGEILVDGQDITKMTERDLVQVRHKIGMVFQEGALFDSLSVRENVGYRLYEESETTEEEIELAVRKLLGFVGLEDAIDKMPAELSGG